MSQTAVVSAGAYLSAFAQVLDRIEVTAGDGRALATDEAIQSIVDRLVSLKGSPRKALLIGNGGSAAIVSHIHNDLCKAVGVRAMVFNEPPFLTAVANDDGYHDVFHRPVDLWSDHGDVLIAISSSGESENIVKAALRAKAKGCNVITFTGFNAGNRLRRIGDVNIYVPAATYGHVEMAHAVVAHCVTDFAMARTTIPSVER